MLRPVFFKFIWKIVILLLVVFPPQVNAADKAASQTLHVAVASNFLFPLKKLAVRFREETGIKLLISSGSTGMLYAQISNGAPYDVFLAADKERPRLLVEKGFAVKKSRVNYAYGHIILWGNDRQIVTEKDSDDCRMRLEKSGRLAIANPQTAPYGMAAKESLQNLGLWKKLEPRIVYGNNIIHTFQFIATGNVDFGIIALSQYLRRGQQSPGCHWVIPEKYHAPLEQQAVILKKAEKNINAAIFMAFLTSDKIQASLKRLGYGMP